MGTYCLRKVDDAHKLLALRQPRLVAVYIAGLHPHDSAVTYIDGPRPKRMAPDATLRPPQAGASYRAPRIAASRLPLQT